MVTSGDARHESDRGTPPEGLPDSVRSRHLAAEAFVFGRYRIVRELGRGGMGAVYLAHDGELGIEVALKLLPDVVVQDEEGLAGLKREVLRGISLTHHGILRTYDFIRDATMAGIVMEYVDGGTLARIKREQPGGCFDAEDLLPWLEQLCPILDFAHFEARIAHRDLKPRNLMVTSTGRLKVADFGISSMIGETVSRVSAQAHTSGTPAYMSPQQVMGGRPSHRDDIYSLGASIFELLTGKPPFHRGRIEAQIMDILPPSMAERRVELGVVGKNPIPPAWESTVAACLAKDPSRRPYSAGGVLALLKAEDWVEPEARAREMIEPIPAPDNVLRRSKLGKAGLAGVIAAAAVAILAFVFWPKQGQEKGPPQPRPDHPVALVPAKPDAPSDGKADPPAPLLPGGRPMASGEDLASIRIGDLRTIELGHGSELTFCAVPAGTFMMGSPPSEPSRSYAEVPCEVTLTRPFWLARTEVTQAQWRALMETDRSEFRGDNLPVEHVTWIEAAEFCRKLTDHARTVNALPEGWEFSLPTEAQWEYACRAGTTGPYAGSGTLGEVGWYRENSGQRTQPVGMKSPNDWGLHDMHGNVVEWCADWDGGRRPGKARDPQGWPSGQKRVNRGGAWLTPDVQCRAAFRSAQAPDASFNYMGFRPAIVPVARPGQTFPSPAVETPSPGPPLAQASARDLVDAKPGQSRSVDLDNAPPLALCAIPAGRFQMGSPVEEQLPGAPMEAMHEVTLTESFLMARTEVTQDQWSSVMGTKPSRYKGGDLPVDSITWPEAVEFCRKLTERESSARRLPDGWRFALPTEAQWEHACRAGTTGPYAGTGDLEDMGWFGANAGSTTHPVGSRKANDWGLFDMHGSVYEWCTDWYADYAAGSVVDPAGPASGENRILRGGSYSAFPAACRSASRHKSRPDGRWTNVGFRVALVPSRQPGQPDAVPAAGGAGIPAKGADAAPQPQAADGAETPIPGSGTRPGQERKFELARGFTITMCWIPPGEFEMGSPPNEKGREPDEKPVKVRISHGFWLAKGECANAQWRAVKGIDGFQSQRSMPVTNVSWDDCRGFLDDLNLKVPMEGWRWDLPTEAQWEYACRAGAAGPYAGNGMLAQMGWHAGNSFDAPHHIGTKTSNDWGLHDMHGNASEWCSDWYGDYPSGTVADPAGPDSGIRRVARGGSWRGGADECRSAKRGSLTPSIRSVETGFRPALVPSK